jgi:hypothetical protein
MYGVNQIFYSVIAVVSIIIIIVMSSTTFVESMSNSNNNACPPCAQQQQCESTDDNGDDNGTRGKRGKKHKKNNSNQPDKVIDEDAMDPSDPNYANIKTIREQRMVQETTMLGSLKKEFESLLLTPVASFCERNKTNGSALQTQCSVLTYDNCNSTSCCVWAGASSQIGKCTAGDAKGSMYKTDPNGNAIHVDTYYYQNKCHGPRCELSKMIKMSHVNK